MFVIDVVGMWRVFGWCLVCILFHILDATHSCCYVMSIYDACGCFMFAYCCLLLEVFSWYANIDDDWNICFLLLLI